MGGSKDSYGTTVWQDRSCWLQPVSDSERTENQHRSQVATHKVYFTTDPGIDERHVLVIGGLYYEVHSVSNPDASVGLGLLYRVMVELIA